MDVGMQSASKIILDMDTLARWSQKHLGKTLVGSREITDGWYNTIHVLELADNSRAVLKVSPPPAFEPMRYERDIMATEVAVHRRLAQAGLRVPHVLADCPDGDGLGHAWFIMEFVEGETWGRLRTSQSPERRAQVDSAIARQSAAVNGIQGERFGRWQEDHCSSSSWATSFQAMVEDLLADARDQSVCLPRSDTALRELVQAARADLDMVRTPRLVLWDLHDGNVIVRPNTLELAGFLDTDRALWGDPLIEFYFRSLANASVAWQDAYRRACAEAGTAYPADVPGAARRMALYDLYLALVMVIEVAYRGYGAEHEAWVRGFCDRALASCERDCRQSEGA
jgi:aminoglycoside phosphotransferase (APT) family kinase protein